MKKITFLAFTILSVLCNAQTEYNFDWNMQSTNQQITIDVGDTVIWTWGSGSHNLISTSGTHTFDSDYHGQGYTYSLTFNEPGVTDYTCTPHSSMYGTITVNSSMSVNENQQLGLKIFPNPVSSGYVTLKTSVSGIKNVELFDLNGKIVLKTSLNTNTLNVGSINPGVYFIKLSVNGVVETSKLIIR
ncbi:T9SS type A sorting domain-containing protein [Flavobacteriaceae bacterium]|nr:T9SS type A sorting domain-containing protein [Flavobacteriaceae bacterium]MDC1310048.1 T9SS type A sorting domain-containing protein [Flavobacteriaceae bacterium]